MATHIAELVDKVQRRADRIDSAKRVQAVDALDEAMAWYSKAVPWDSLRRKENFLTNSSEFLVFPDRVLKVISIADLTNSYQLEPGGSLGHRHQGSYFNRTSGRLCEWRDLGLVPVIAQPESLTAVDVRTTVSDNFNVFVRGLSLDTAASGTALERPEVEETISITSSGAVTSTNTFLEILSISKDKDTAGDLVVDYTVGGRRVSRIPRWESRPLFPRVQLFFVPNPNVTVEVEYYRRPDRINNESSAVDPSVDEEALIWRAAGNMHWADQEGQSAQIAWSKAEQILAAKKNVEEAFGEKDFHVEPMRGSYFEQEGLNWWNGGFW